MNDPTTAATDQAGFTPLLQQTLAQIAGPDAAALAEARARQDQLTKPRGALGVLEDLSVQLAGLAGQCPPPVPASAAVAVFAGDHGVHAQGVSPWPQEVTTQMVANIATGGAAVNVLAAQVGAQVLVVDVGVAGELPELPGLQRRRVRAGTGDFTLGPAMTRAEALAGIETGIAVARELAGAGHTLLATGDMGIANTTPSAALVAAFTGADPSEVTGRGTGIDDATWTLKVDVVRRGLARHSDTIRDGDPVDVLAAVGGLEHAAIAGFVLGAAALRLPVLLDGVIAGAAALVAAALTPAVLDACVAGHRSAEPGHTVALAALNLTPLIDLDLRLGEGTGAVLALPLVQGAVATLREMATFDAAGVTDKSS